MDIAGRLLAVLLSPGQASDHRYAPHLALEAARHGMSVVMGDKGYDSTALRDSFARLSIEPIIPTRRNKPMRPAFDKTRYKKRNMIERFIGAVKENRRVATRYDKRADHYEGFIVLAALKNWLKFIC